MTERFLKTNAKAVFFLKAILRCFPAKQLRPGSYQDFGGPLPSSLHQALNMHVTI